MIRLPRLFLATALLAGAYVVMAGVILLDLAIMVSPIVLYEVHPTTFPLAELSGWLGGISATSIMAIGGGIALARRHAEEPWPSVELPPRDAGELTAMIDDIAAKSKATAVPAELRLTAAANAGVSEGPQAFGLGERSRRLYLGLPVLAGMTRIQLKAVLSHEIGHYAGGHSRFGVLVHRGSLSLGTVRNTLRMARASSPAQVYPQLRFAARIPWAVLMVYVIIDYAIISAYSVLYNRVCYAIRRRQEYEADAAAARIVGGAELAGALRRIYALSSAWDEFQGRYLKPMRQAGCIPDDPFDAFRNMLGDPDYQDVLRGWEQSPPDSQPSPTDTHPCLADRIARLNGRPDSDPATGSPVTSATGPPAVGGDGPQAVGAGDREPAVTILPALADRPWIPELCAATLSPGGALESLPWDECVNRVGQQHAAAAGSVLLAAVAAAVAPVGDSSGGSSSASGSGSGGASDSSDANPSARDVLDLVAVRRAELAALLTGPGEDPVARLSKALLALLGHMMVATGHVRWQLAWRDSGGGVLRLVPCDSADPGIERFADRVTSFVANPDAPNADAIILHLLGLGINPAFPVALDPAPPVVLDTSGKPRSAPGTKLVIRPRTNEQEAEYKGLTRLIGIPLAMTAGILGIAVTLTHQNDTAAVPLPPVVAYSPPSIPVPQRFSIPAEPVVLPSLPVMTFPSLSAGCSGVFLSDCEAVTVQPGDTLSLLACRYRTTVTELQDMNDMFVSTVVKAGQRLYVPIPKGGPAACS